jgi:lipopolysaccharide biosynthesis glycosyltransferase
VKETPLRIFIGYDSKEPTAYHVLAHSILRQASIPVAITPLALPNLARIYKRERGPLESTEFSLTRFLVPYLSNYEGHSVFLDCDMLCQADILELFFYILTFPEAALLVVPHDYTPKSSTKFLGQVQSVYPRKNWSSMMVFNNERCKALTPDYVNSASGAELHQFKWLDDSEIEFLPPEWNWLVGEYRPNPNAKLLHYTLGGPWFPETADCDHSDLWEAEKRRLLHT